jgi:endonuclease/exonuclease/phosphatase family metal-dependent hydrolase
MTLNLWQGRLSRNYPDFIADQKADVICLQEVYSSEIDLPGLETFNSRQKAEKASGLEYSFFSPTYAFNVLDKTVQYGNLILSRYPFSQTDTIFTSGQYTEYKKSSDYVANTRNAQVVKISLEGRELTVVNHHAYWEPVPGGSTTSFNNIKFLSQELSNFKSPLIVAGDFNLSSDTEAIRYFKETLKLKNLNDGKYPSTLSKEVSPFTVDCDYIFVSSEIDSQNFFLSDKLASDHRALILDFSIKS